jgi:alkylated DNA repair dioxygenase AlkB
VDCGTTWYCTLYLVPGIHTCTSTCTCTSHMGILLVVLQKYSVNCVVCTVHKWGTSLPSVQILSLSKHSRSCTPHGNPITHHPSTITHNRNNHKPTMAFHKRLLVFAVVVAYSKHTLGFSTTTSSKNAASIGEAIQLASSQEELLQVAAQLWLPTDPDLPRHLLSQRVHHEKRQRWSAQLLEKLGSVAAMSCCLDDDRLCRAIRSASVPFAEQCDRPDKEGRYIRQALCGLHALVGKIPGNQHRILPVDAVDGIRQLIARADAMAPDMPLPHIVEMRFAARGLLARLLLQRDTQIPNMDRRVQKLPFDIIPLGVDWEQVVQGDDNVAIHEFLREIPFRFDTITTRTGAVVVERRGTAWLAAPGIGALAYSGKLMAPKPIPPAVADTMRQVEVAMGMSPNYFDCALCNHYPDDEAACKFHTDPEHGTLWERLTCVVALGDSRRFAFRPIPGQNQWTKWDTVAAGAVDNGMQDDTAPAAIHLFSGDIVQMWGECNDLFHHAVYTAEGERQISPHGRVSLVLKRAIDRGGGKRGHGLAGEGRRSKRTTTTDRVSTPSSQSSMQRRTRNKPK